MQPTNLCHFAEVLLCAQILSEMINSCTIIVQVRASKCLWLHDEDHKPYSSQKPTVTMTLQIMHSRVKYRINVLHYKLPTHTNTNVCRLHHHI